MTHWSQSGAVSSRRAATFFPLELRHLGDFLRRSHVWNIELLAAHNRNGNLCNFTFSINMQTPLESLALRMRKKCSFVFLRCWKNGIQIEHQLWWRIFVNWGSSRCWLEASGEPVRSLPMTITKEINITKPVRHSDGSKNIPCMLKDDCDFWKSCTHLCQWLKLLCRIILPWGCWTCWQQLTTWVSQKREWLLQIP